MTDIKDTTSGITERLVLKLRERDAVGKAKYGTTLDRTDLTLAEWLVHLQEELLDASGYIETVLREMDAKADGETADLIDSIRTELLNTPVLHEFAEGAVLEALHQRGRWGAEHDAGKAPLDWFWLIGYLAQKVVTALDAGDSDKALHHTISTAAVLANWHAHIEIPGAFRPGLEAQDAH